MKRDVDKRELDDRGLRLWPQHVSDWVWYYEEKGGICIIVQPRAKETGELLAAVPAFVIPWRKIAGSVDRHRNGKPKPKPKRRRS